MPSAEAEESSNEAEESSNEVEESSNEVEELSDAAEGLSIGAEKLSTEAEGLSVEVPCHGNATERLSIGVAGSGIAVERLSGAISFLKIAVPGAKVATPDAGCALVSELFAVSLGKIARTETASQRASQSTPNLTRRTRRPRSLSVVKRSERPLAGNLNPASPRHRMTQRPRQCGTDLGRTQSRTAIRPREHETKAYRLYTNSFCLRRGNLARPVRAQADR